MERQQAHKIEWVDGGKWTQVQPNPAYPTGIDIDLSDGATRTCIVKLPYPAKRIGHYKVVCPVCGFMIMCSTEGRPDDPRSLTIPCAIGGKVQ